MFELFIVVFFLCSDMFCIFLSVPPLSFVDCIFCPFWNFVIHSIWFFLAQPSVREGHWFCCSHVTPSSVDSSFIHEDFLEMIRNQTTHWGRLRLFFSLKTQMGKGCEHETAGSSGDWWDELLLSTWSLWTVKNLFLNNNNSLVLYTDQPGEVNNPDYLVTMALVSGWDILGEHCVLIVYVLEAGNWKAWEFEWLWQEPNCDV